MPELVFYFQNNLTYSGVVQGLFSFYPLCVYSQSVLKGE